MSKHRVLIGVIACSLFGIQPSFGQSDQSQTNSGSGNGRQTFGSAMQQFGQGMQDGAARSNPQLQRGLAAESEHKNMEEKTENLRLQNEILREKLKRMRQDGGE